jgi:pimeloyl-ACP methyl ester carboxylesterase
MKTLGYGYRGCVLGALLLAPLHAQIAEHYKVGAQSAWSIEQADVRIGVCATRYHGTTAIGGFRAHHFSDQVDLPSGGAGAPRIRTTVERWLDEQGHPLRFELRAQVVEMVSSVEGTFAAGRAELVVHQGARDRSVAVDKLEDAYLLANNMVAHLELLLALAPQLPQQDFTLFSANALVRVPYTLKLVGRSAAGGWLYEDSLHEQLELSPRHELLRVELTAQKIVFRRVEEAIETFTIALPQRALADDLEHEDVAIVDGDVRLAGTITRPKGAQGRLPALTFLSGSGPQDRDGYSSGIDLGTHEILDRLTRDGFLVLRFDDRGVGASSGPLEDFDFDDIVADSRRALHFLRARPDVDPERVALLGHSEGGISAPLLATQEHVAAIALLAAPGRPLEALLREQLRAGRSKEGASERELEKFDAEVTRFLAAIDQGEPLDARELPAELAAFVPARAWVKSHLGRDPLALVAQLQCPVLLLQGARDVQVSAERDAPKLLEALVAAKHVDHALLLFPELDHLFKQAGNPPSELDYLRSRPVDPAFLDALSGWLRARLMK